VRLIPSHEVIDVLQTQHTEEPTGRELARVWPGKHGFGKQSLTTLQVSQTNG
jgi:hypothetical protein